jgi:hypothetical protein
VSVSQALCAAGRDGRRTRNSVRISCSIFEILSYHEGAVVRGDAFGVLSDKRRVATLESLRSSRGTGGVPCAADGSSMPEFACATPFHSCQLDTSTFSSSMWCSSWEILEFRFDASE